MSVPRCPVCEGPIDPLKTAVLPFCSDRCRWIDLKRWLGEEYRMPGEPTEDEHWNEPLEEPQT